MRFPFAPGVRDLQRDHVRLVLSSRISKGIRHPDYLLNVIKQTFFQTYFALDFVRNFTLDCSQRVEP